jgi:hypothetical protein
MNIAVIFVTLVVVGVGVLANRTDVFDRYLRSSDRNKKTVLSSEDEQDAHKDDEEANALINPTETSVQSPTSTPTMVINNNDSFSTGMSYYNYPNSEIVNSSSAELVIRSQDDTDIITNWYKNKIIERGMSVRNFVKTKTNNNILNSLSGASNEEKIEIEISKSPTSKFTKIKINL